MKKLPRIEKVSIIFNYGCFLTSKRGFDVHSELIKQLVMLEVCVNYEKPCPKQLEPLNELREHLRKNEYEYPISDVKTETPQEARELREISEIILNEIDKYVIDYSEEELQTFKANMK